VQHLYFRPTGETSPRPFPTHSLGPAAQQPTGRLLKRPARLIPPGPTLAHPSADRQEPLIAVDQDRTVVRPYCVNKNPFRRSVPSNLSPIPFLPTSLSLTGGGGGAPVPACPPATVMMNAASTRLRLSHLTFFLSPFPTSPVRTRRDSESCATQGGLEERGGQRRRRRARSPKSERAAVERLGDSASRPCPSQRRAAEVRRAVNLPCPPAQRAPRRRRRWWWRR
jgi:hypothetical protein